MIPQEIPQFLSVNGVCRKFTLSRSAFYRMLNAHPELEEEGIVLRIPPSGGPYRVDVAGFMAWIKNSAGSPEPSESI